MRVLGELLQESLLANDIIIPLGPSGLGLSEALLLKGEKNIRGCWVGVLCGVTHFALRFTKLVEIHTSFQSYKFYTLRFTETCTYTYNRADDDTASR